MTTTVKMQQIKENANQCEMTILEYVKDAMSAEGDQFAKWFFEDDTAELNAETESQILNELGF